MTDDIDALEASLTQRSIELSITVDGTTYREFVPIKDGFPTRHADEDEAVMILASQVGGIALQVIAQHFAPGLLETVSAEFTEELEKIRNGEAGGEE